ncbi:MAG: hypothetical protein WD025_02930 [Bacteriovoracaceae bacterium]
MKKSHFAFLLVLSFLFASCDKLNDMSDNAVKASENSGRAADAASESRDEIAQGRIMSRAGAAKEARGKALERMKAAKSLEGKVIEATTYYKAFEYLLWTGQRYDSKEYLYELMEDAFNELYRTLRELNDEKSLADTGPTAFRILAKRKDRDRNILALSLAMHKVHGLQSTKNPMASADFEEGTSPLDIIKSSLAKIKKYENGIIDYHELRNYEVAIYENIGEFISLVNTRYNMILTLALSELTNIDESKKEALLSLALPTSWKKLNSEYLSINDAQKRAANRYLNSAFDLKKFMLENEYEVVMDKRVRKIFKKLVNPVRSDDRSFSALSARDQDSVAEHYETLGKLFELDGTRIVGEAK